MFHKSSEFIIHKKLGKLLLILGLAFLGSFGARQVLAAAAQPGFGVSIVQNAYQTKELGYFDLSGLKPGQKTTLQLQITNHSDTAAAFDCFANDAATNQNLIIDYSGVRAPRQKVSGPLFSEIAQSERKTYTVPAHGKQTISIYVTMPKQTFDGQVMGGIFLKKHLDPNQTGSIKNRFSYANTVVLRQGNQKLTANPVLTKASYKVNYTIPTVTAAFENRVQAYAANLKIKQSVLDAKNQVLKTSNQTYRAIAPQSQTNIFFKLDKLLAPGKYWMLLETSIGGHKVSSKQPFTVNEAATINAKVRTINRTLWCFIGMCAFFILIILFILWWFLIWKRRKKDQEETPPTNSNQINQSSETRKNKEAEEEERP